MIIKWISCTVPQEQKQNFSRAQEQWSGLKGVPGFVGQTGGWNISKPQEACILSLWDDDKSYEHFMTNIHDDIFAKSGQKDTYQSIDVNLYELVCSIPGSDESIRNTLQQGSLIRMADSVIYEHRQKHFVDTQRKVWNPGMAKAPGMLSGVFGREVNNQNRYLVATLWEDEQAHMDYVVKIFPNLNIKAGVSGDIQHIAGRMVRVEKKWVVTAGLA